MKKGSYVLSNFPALLIIRIFNLLYLIIMKFILQVQVSHVQ